MSYTVLYLILGVALFLMTYYTLNSRGVWDKIIHEAYIECLREGYKVSYGTVGKAFFIFALISYAFVWPLMVVLMFYKKF